MNWEVAAGSFFLSLMVSSATFMLLDRRFSWPQFRMVCVGAAGIIGLLTK